MKAAYAPYQLKFIEPGGTSRGVMHVKDTYFLKIWDEENPEVQGVGECALFRGLSADDVPDYEDKLKELCENIERGEMTDLSTYPSIRFGLETAIYDYSNGGRGICFPSKFTAGETAIPINGLVWMGTKEEMLARIDAKVAAGFHTIKLKIGAIDFESELAMLRYIRERYSAESLTIRVDANGGFTAENVMQRLEQLSRYDLHSIEQPIKPRQYMAMARVCATSPVPVALDEELIGLHSTEEKEAMLTFVKPQYIVLKPSLVGGFSGALDWLRASAGLDVGGWITSALESNVGLNAIAQWTATLKPGIPQGLGTGGVFSNNCTSPLYLEGETLRFDPNGKWQLPELEWITK